MKGKTPELARNWQAGFAYPLLLLILFESLSYIIINGYGQQDKLLPYSIIIFLAISITQVRLVSGVYLPNIMLGPLTILLFIHYRYYSYHKLIDYKWLQLLLAEIYRELTSEITSACLGMLLVWFLVHVFLKRLVRKGKIIGLLIIGLIIQGLIFSYKVRAISPANINFMGAGLMLLSLVRFGALKSRWNSKGMYGAEDLDLKWVAGAITWISIVILIVALLPPPASQINIQDSRFRVIGKLMNGTAATPSKEGGTEKVNSNGEQKSNNFKSGAEVLGGPWFRDNTLVMTVTSDKPAYWRAMAREFYDGKQWDTRLKGTASKDPTRYQGIRTESVKQDIMLGANYVSPVGFGATLPVAVSGLKGQYIINANDDLVFVSKDMKPGIRYTVSSEIPILDANSLELLRQSRNDYPAEIKEMYLQLPSIPERVKDLAENITRDKNNSFDKAQALADYLRNNQELQYNLKPEPTPSGRDFVDFFLFDGKKGYCTYYSTAMAIMARSIGLPSRWVVGYTAGISNEKTPNVYRVSEMNKHAWVEIYFAGIGWIPFEPTKNFRMPLELESVVNPPAAEPVVSEDPQTVNWDGKGYPFIILLSLVIIALVLARIFRKKEGQELAPLIRVIKRKRSTRDQIYAAYLAFLRAMQKIGKGRLLSQTPGEFARDRELDMKAESTYINSLTKSFEQARYGNSPQALEQVEKAMKDLGQIKKDLENTNK